MKIATAIKRAKEKSNGNLELYKLKLFNIGLKYHRALLNPEFKKEWDLVVQNAKRI